MSKKKLSAEEKLFIKRSRSAKKGWRTRRANIKAENERLRKTAPKVGRKNNRKTEPTRPNRIDKINSKTTNSKLSSKKRTSKKRTKKAKETQKQQLKRIKEENKRLKEILSVAKETKGWTVDPITHNKKGELAKFSSSLRISKNRDLIEKRLRKANRDGELDEVADEIADLYDVDIKEVYSFFFSP